MTKDIDDAVTGIKLRLIKGGKVNKPAQGPVVVPHSYEWHQADSCQTIDGVDAYFSWTNLGWLVRLVGIGDLQVGYSTLQSAAIAARQAIKVFKKGGGK